VIPENPVILSKTDCGLFLINCESFLTNHFPDLIIIAKTRGISFALALAGPVIQDREKRRFTP
jgi:hypothetical protein